MFTALGITLTYYAMTVALAQIDPRKSSHERDKAALCSEEQPELMRLKIALKLTESDDIGMRIKRREVYFRRPPDSEVSLSQESPEYILSRIRSNLDRLDSDDGTAALIYRVHKSSNAHVICSILVTPDLLISERTEWSGEKTVAQATLEALKVAARASPQTAQTRSDGVRSGGAFIETDDRTPETREVLRSVAQILFPPRIQEQIRSGQFRRLLILASGDLPTLPFAALPLGEKQLIDRVSIVMLADVYGLLDGAARRTDYSDGAKLIVGNPDLSHDTKRHFSQLDYAQTEANEVAQLFSASTLTGKQASHDTVWARLQQKSLRLIYFATHGIADANDPMDEGLLALAQRHLYGNEITRLRLENRPLVVMSACQSGLGKILDGSVGVFGLARAWYFAGAPQVVMSLWNINDKETMELMTHFMRLLREREAPEEALRHAMIESRRRNPEKEALWAAFAVFGDATHTH
jgi:CHAT domain-containing protein